MWKFICSAVFVAAVWFFVASCSQGSAGTAKPPRAGAEMRTATEEANDFLEKDKVAMAERVLKRAAGKAADLSALYGRTWWDVLLREGRYQEILDDPSAKKSFFYLAAQALKGDWQNAAAELKPDIISRWMAIKGIEKDYPDLKSQAGVGATLLLRIGLDYSMETKDALAFWYFKQAAALTPENPLCAYRYAEALVDAKMFAEAKAVLSNSDTSKSALKEKVDQLKKKLAAV